MGKLGRHSLFAPTIVSLLLWFTKTVFIVVVPLRYLAISPWLIDDSFIFMRIARNLAQGYGYSFDGLNPTTGAPLLWTVLTAPNHLLLGRETAAKATLIESAFFGSLCLLLVFWLARRYGNGRIAWGAFILSTLLSPQFFNAMNGMETSLFACLGLASVALYLNAREMQSWRGYAGTGALLGLAILTRADGVFLALAIGLVDWLRWATTRDWVRFRNLVVLTFATALFASPMPLWSLLVDGTIMPANQAGRRMLAWEIMDQAPDDRFWRAYWAMVLLNLDSLSKLIAMGFGSALIVFLAIGSSPLWRQWRIYGEIIIVYLGSFLAMLVLYQWYFPDVHGLRYLALPIYLASPILVAFLHRHISHWIRHPQAQQGIFSVALLFLLVLSASKYLNLTETWGEKNGMQLIPLYDQREVDANWAWIDWIRTELPEGTVIAAKDHGRLAYFTRTHIVDLAGILDHSLVEHLQHGTMGTYLVQHNVEYVVLPPKGGWQVHEAVRATVDVEETQAPAQVYPDYRLYLLEAVNDTQLTVTSATSE